jgi:hypothetical protein
MDKPDEELEEPEQDEESPRMKLFVFYLMVCFIIGFVGGLVFYSPVPQPGIMALYDTCQQLYMNIMYTTSNNTFIIDTDLDISRAYIQGGAGVFVHQNANYITYYTDSQCVSIIVWYL